MPSFRVHSFQSAPRRKCYRKSLCSQSLSALRATRQKSATNSSSFLPRVEARCLPRWGSTEMRLRCGSCVAHRTNGHNRSGKSPAKPNCRARATSFYLNAIQTRGDRAIVFGERQCFRSCPSHSLYPPGTLSRLYTLTAVFHLWPKKASRGIVRPFCGYVKHFLAKC